MPEWLFWLTLGAMLAGGSIVGVGLFLDRFAIGSFVASMSALLLDFQLEQQLHAFLFASGLSLALGRIVRNRKLKAAT